MTFRCVCPLICTTGHQSAIKTVAVNVHGRAVVWICPFISFGFIPQSGIAGSHGELIFHSLEVAAPPHVPISRACGSAVPASSPPSAIVRLSVCSRSVGAKWISGFSSAVGRWLTMSSVFSCASLPSGCLLWGSSVKISYPFFCWAIFFSLSCKSSLYTWM